MVRKYSWPFKEYGMLFLVLVPVILFFAAGLGAFGPDWQEFIVDVIWDARSYHIRQH